MQTKMLHLECTKGARFFPYTEGPRLFGGSIRQFQRSCPSQRRPACAALDAHATGAATQLLRHAAAVATLTDGTVAVGVADSAASVQSTAAQQQDWLSPISDSLQAVLDYIQTGLEQYHVPFSYGWSIIALTIVTKIATFPFTKAQIESALETQKLKPTIEAIKRQYSDDKARVQRETSALYEASGVNPLAGCLPTLATIPIFWGLYRTLSNVANQGLLTEGFYWIPSLSGPTSLSAQRAGSGTAWLFPLVDGAPPVGWDEASRYLALPILLVVAQFASSAIISPPIKDEDEGAAVSRAVLVGAPFLVGWFALNVPSGLSLYYFSNTVITSAIQIWLRKLGGAKAFEWQQDIGLNQARRTGEVADLETLAWEPTNASLSAGLEPTALPSAASQDTLAHAAPDAVASNGASLQEISRRCKRKRLASAASAVT